MGMRLDAASQDAELARPLVDIEEEDEGMSSKMKRLSLAAVLSCLVVVNTTFSISAPIFPQEAARHGVGPTLVGGIFSSFSFVDFAASLAFGRLLQQRVLSRRRTLACSLVVVSIGTALFGLVAQIQTRFVFVTVCLALRLVEGIACAAVDTSATATIASLYKQSDYFGTVMGLAEATMSIGWVVGPVIGGSLATSFGFGAPFYVIGALALVFTPAAFFLLPADERTSRDVNQKPTDVKSLLLHAPIAVLIVTAAVSAAMLTWGDPVLSPHLEGIGFSVTAIGFTFALQAIVYALFSPVAGLLSDRVGRYPVICCGLALCGLACILLGPMPSLPLPPEGHASVWWAMLALGLGAALAFTPITPAILSAAQDKVGVEQQGLEDIVSGIISGTFYLGCGGGPVLGGLLTQGIGFAWTAAIFGALTLAQAVVVACLFAWSGRSRQAGAAADHSDEDSLLQRPSGFGRRYSFSHDSGRDARGGLRAPSHTFTSEEF